MFIIEKAGVQRSEIVRMILIANFLLRISEGSDSVLSALQTHLTILATLQVGAIIILILQNRKLRQRS